MEYKSFSTICSDAQQLSKALLLSINSWRKATANTRNATSQLIENCKHAGLQFHGRTPADGSCFFHAVSDQMSLQGHSIDSKTLRNNVVDLMVQNHILQGPDGLIDLKQTVSKDWGAYCHDMRNGSEWADATVVIATAHMLQKDILIVTSSPTSSDNNLVWIVGVPNYGGRPIMLGHVFEQHYESLQVSEEEFSNSLDEQLKEKSANAEGAPSPSLLTKSLFSPGCPNVYLEEVPKEIAIDIQEKITNFLPSLTPVEAAFKSFMEKKHQRGRIKTDVTLEVHLLENGIGVVQFIFDYLQNCEATGRGAFTLKKAHQSGNIQYKCERSRKPKGKHTDPTKTRANDCGSYVSFCVDEEGGRKAVIVRSMLQHTGHDPTDIEERRVSRIDAELVSHINTLIDEGRKGFEILPYVAKWSLTRGHKDFWDRKFFPTPKDINYLVDTRKAQQRYDRNDAVSVDWLCTSELKSNILFYQPLHSQADQPLIIVYQNEKQLERMTKLCKDVVFMDATYKGLTGYGYAFYCLLARDEAGHGTPVSYFITSEDSESVVSICLRVLKESTREKGRTFAPRSFMVDKDFKEIRAIQTVFPECQVLLCWFHVLQATYRWLNKQGSGITGKQDVDKRMAVINYMRKLRSCTTLETFSEAIENMRDNLPNEQCAAYIEQNWIPVKEMWCLLGRRFNHGDHDTNNIVERFFLSLKYHFLHGYANRRLDDLLQLLDKDVSTTYDYIEGLTLAGRIVDEKATKRCQGRRRAETMISQGWSNIVIWHTDELCYVPSQTAPGEKGYFVDVIRSTCDCQSSSQGGMCKHLHTALILAAARGYDLEEQRMQKAASLLQNSAFNLDYPFLTVFDESMGMVNMETMTCICIAASHGIKCICKNTALLLKANNTNMISKDEADPVVQSETVQSHINEAVQSDISKKKFKELLSDVSAWAETTDIVSPSALCLMKKLHSCLFSKFKHVHRQRKIWPLHPYRKLVKKAKQTMTIYSHHDHTYGGKRKGRYRRSVRPQGLFERKKRRGRQNFLNAR